MNLSAYTSVTKEFEFLRKTEKLSAEGRCVMCFARGQWCLRPTKKINDQYLSDIMKAGTVVEGHSRLRSLRKDNFHQKFGSRSEFGRSVRWLLLDLLRGVCYWCFWIFHFNKEGSHL